MKGSDLATILREDYLDDAVKEYLWSDAALLRFINNAQREASVRGHFVYDDTTPAYTQIPLKKDKSEYRLHGIITRILCVTVGGIPYTLKTRPELDYQKPGWRTKADLEPTYIVNGRIISFFPVPTADSTAKLEVYRSPKPLNDLDAELETILEFQTDLVHHCLFEAYNKRDQDTYDANLAKYHLELFNGIFGKPVTAAVRQHQLESPHLHVARPNNYFKSTTRTVRFR